MQTSQRAVDLEEKRIQSAYARRTAESMRYSAFDSGHLFMIQELERFWLMALKAHGVASLVDRRILEIGCGSGHWLRECVKWGALPENLAGVDLLADRIARARELSPPGVLLTCTNAVHLLFPDSSFDIVLQATVFTSILDEALKTAIAVEMLRVLKPGGIILWYDFRVNNPRNPDVRGIERAEIVRLFSGCRVHLRRITLAPPLLRLIAPYSWLTTYLLSAVPWACSHYCGVIQKP